MSSSGSAWNAGWDELRALYRRLDDDLAALGVECRACGRCCNFQLAAYTLYASQVELALVERESAAPFTLKDDGRCCFQDGNRCTIHPVRPLACRTFFCDDAFKEPAQELYETYLRRLKGIVRQLELEWNYRQVLP